MERCTGCGGMLAPNAEWCLQCFAPVGAPAPVPVPAAVGSERAAPSDLWARATTTTWSTAQESSVDDGAHRADVAVGRAAPSGRNVYAPGAIVGLGVLLGVAVGVLHLLDGGSSADVVRTTNWVYAGYYGAVVAWVAAKWNAVGFHPTWTRGPALPAVAFGAAVGAAVCGLVALASRAILGELRLDALVFDLSDVTFSSTGVVLLFLLLAGPVVQEVLFRGLLLENMAPVSVPPTLAIGGVLFALWHAHEAFPYGFPYIVVAAVLLPLVWWRWGLVSSIACHVAFAGTMLVLAVVFVLGAPAKTVTVQGLAFDLPGGWHEVDDPAELVRLPNAVGEPLVGAVGPGGAQLVVEKLTHDIPGGWNADFLLMFVNDWAHRAGNDEERIVAESLRPVEYPAGRAAEAEFVVGGEPGRYVVFFKGSDVYFITMSGFGSTRAADFEGIVRSVRLP